MKQVSGAIQYTMLILCGCLASVDTPAQTGSSGRGEIIDQVVRDYTPRLEAERVSEADTLQINFLLEEARRFREVNADSSFSYLDKATVLALESMSVRLISGTMKSLGNQYLITGLYHEAIECYLNCLKLEECLKDHSRIAALYDALGSVNYFMEVFDRSLSHHTRALEIYEELNDTTGIAGVLSHLGSLHLSREFCEQRSTEEKSGDFHTAIDYFKKSVYLSQLTGDGDLEARGNQNIAAAYNNLSMPDTALPFIKRAVDHYMSEGDILNTSSTLYTLGLTYHQTKEYGKAIEALKEAEMLSLQYGSTGDIQYLYDAIAIVSRDMNDYKTAYEYYMKYMIIRDSVYNAGKSKQILELESKYKSEVMENEILTLTSEKERRRSVILILSGIILFLGSSVYYYVRLMKKSRIIANQDIRIREEKIHELEQDKLLLATRSVLEGEEAERSRLAGDLHHGLGGLLSGIKINMSSMKENAVLSSENVSAFNHAISLLDRSIGELRRIAHNLMPETLKHYGLRTALEDFCRELISEGPPDLAVQCFGDDIRFARELELTTYRITQELVNNAMKHSQATKIDVQLFSEPNRLFVQVTDNGTGFDNCFSDKGMPGKGLGNIRDRVNAFGGRMEVWSKPGEGSEISVEFLL